MAYLRGEFARRFVAGLALGCGFSRDSDGRRLALVGFENALELAVESFIGLSVRLSFRPSFCQFGSSLGQFIGGGVDFRLKGDGAIAGAFKLPFHGFMTGLPFGELTITFRQLFPKRFEFRVCLVWDFPLLAQIRKGCNAIREFVGDRLFIDFPPDTDASEEWGSFSGLVARRKFNNVQI
jgi:hypothetical protein